MSDDRFDAIVVGGGLAGLAAAFTLAQAEKSVLVIEKGDYCGAKNVTGGRLYVAPLAPYFEKLLQKAPLERSISQEELCIMSPEGSLTLSYTNQQLAQTPGQSYSVCRAPLDKYLAKQAEKQGAIIASKQRVDSLLVESGKVVGVCVGGESLYAKVVICADGVLSLLPQQAGLRGPLDPGQYAVGIKETIELDPALIEARFNVSEGQGAARLFMGDVTAGIFGGGFLYTNKESISLGIVVGIPALGKSQQTATAPELLDRFKARPELAALIKGGHTVEYAAHAVHEGSYESLCKLYGNGVLVAGESAGFSLNAGITVRGMEYALASGHLAAKAVIQACNAQDYSAQSLSVYEKLLQESFVLKDFIEHKTVARSLEHDRFFTHYPSMVTRLMGDLYTVNGPKKRIFTTAKKHLNFSVLREILLKDFGKVTKL